VLNKLKLIWNESGLQAILEQQILTGFLWISAEIPLETSWRALHDEVGLEGDVAQHG